MAKHPGSEDDSLPASDVPTLPPAEVPSQRASRTWLWWVGGFGCALAGLIGSIFALVVILLFITADPEGIKEAANRTDSLHKLRLITIANYEYLLAHQRFPAAYSMDSEGRPLLSWRVHLLPYLGHADLYEQFHLDEPWDSPHNRSLIPLMPDIYLSPLSQAAEGKTTYLGNAVTGGAFAPPDAAGALPVGGHQPESFTNGTKETIHFLEVNDGRAVTWTQPADFDPPLGSDLYVWLRLSDGGTFQVVFADGASNTMLADDIDHFQRILTRDGKGVLNQDKRP